MSAHLDAAAEVVVDLARQRSARLGGSRLVCIEGPAGAGKTTLATAVERRAHALAVGVALVHLDDVFDGWEGLPTVGATLLRDVVRPLAARRPATYRRYDWHAGRYAGESTVVPTDLVVLEGVGAGHVGFADLVSLLVWVEAPEDLRLRRALERDGADLEPRLREWQQAEALLHTREDTRARAQVTVDGVTGETVVR